MSTVYAGTAPRTLDWGVVTKGVQSGFAAKEKRAEKADEDTLEMFKYLGNITAHSADIPTTTGMVNKIVDKYTKISAKYGSSLGNREAAGAIKDLKNESLRLYASAAPVFARNLATATALEKELNESKEPYYWDYKVDKQYKAWVAKGTVPDKENPQNYNMLDPNLASQLKGRVSPNTFIQAEYIEKMTPNIEEQDTGSKIITIPGSVTTENPTGIKAIQSKDGTTRALTYNDIMPRLPGIKQDKDGKYYLEEIPQGMYQSNVVEDYDRRIEYLYDKDPRIKAEWDKHYAEEEIKNKGTLPNDELRQRVDDLFIKKMIVKDYSDAAELNSFTETKENTQTNALTTKPAEEIEKEQPTAGGTVTIGGSKETNDENKGAFTAFTSSESVTDWYNTKIKGTALGYGQQWLTHLAVGYLRGEINNNHAFSPQSAARLANTLAGVTGSAFEIEPNAKNKSVSIGGIVVHYTDNGDVKFRVNRSATEAQQKTALDAFNRALTISIVDDEKLTISTTKNEYTVKEGKMILNTIAHATVQTIVDPKDNTKLNPSIDLSAFKGLSVYDELTGKYYSVNDYEKLFKDIVNPLQTYLKDNEDQPYNTNVERLSDTNPLPFITNDRAFAYGSYVVTVPTADGKGKRLIIARQPSDDPATINANNLNYLTGSLNSTLNFSNYWSDSPKIPFGHTYLSASKPDKDNNITITAYNKRDFKKQRTMKVKASDYGFIEPESLEAVWRQYNKDNTNSFIGKW